MIYFFGVNQEYGFLSQWYITKFCDIYNSYSSTEQYMMFQKALLFNDIDTSEKIINTDDPRKIKILGRKIKNFNQFIWDANKFKIVTLGNILKFSQNDDIRYKLISTGSHMLVEASPYDKIWGIGLSKEEALITDQSLWPGQNLLGKSLMKVREVLK